jgi:ATP-binding cassette subfamily B protein
MKTNPTATIPTARAIRFLLSHLKKHSLALALGFVVLVGVDSLQLVIPRIIQQVLDRLGGASNAGPAIVKGSLTILLLSAGMVVLRFLWRLFIVKPSRQIEEQMRLDMFGHLERLSAPFFNRTKTGDLMALFVNDIGAIRMATGMALIGLFDAIFMSVMSLIFMVAISPRLTLVTAAPLPVIIFLFIKTGRMIESRYTVVQESFAAISSHVQESFSGVRVIKGFAREESELARFRTACGAYVEQNLALTRVWGLIFPSITFLASLSFSLLLFFGGRAVMANRLTVGQFVSFTFYINLLVWPMIASGWVWNLAQRGIASTKRVLELLDSQPDVRDAGAEVEAKRTPALRQAFATEKMSALGQIHRLPPLKGRIEFRDLTFRYAEGSPDVLANINLVVPAGSSLGIIGKPGSGKTTLASLLFHLYPVERSRLFIDGKDINDLPLAAVRSAIAYVPQDSFLFSDTIAANIAFACRDAAVPGGLRQQAAEGAAKLAAIHRDIMKFTDGYNTRIGERGVMLSGGQKQRVAIARALMAEGACICVLDDALSAVDVATEAEILANIGVVIANRTSIIIAHRISTVRRCDAVIVLENGRIAEQGTHDELVKRGGFYSTLWELQRMKGQTGETA